jgi:hypothetical protein
LGQQCGDSQAPFHIKHQGTSTATNSKQIASALLTDRQQLTA